MQLFKQAQRVATPGAWRGGTSGKGEQGQVTGMAVGDTPGTPGLRGWLMYTARVRPLWDSYGHLQCPHPNLSLLQPCQVLCQASLPCSPLGSPQGITQMDQVRGVSPQGPLPGRRHLLHLGCRVLSQDRQTLHFGSLTPASWPSQPHWSVGSGKACLWTWGIFSRRPYNGRLTGPLKRRGRKRRGRNSP